MAILSLFFVMVSCRSKQICKLQKMKTLSSRCKSGKNKELDGSLQLQASHAAYFHFYVKTWLKDPRLHPPGGQPRHPQAVTQID